MGIDVTAEVLIQRNREEVARYAIDPENDPVWIGGIVEATPPGDPSLRSGSRVQRAAKFLGRRIEYVLEVTDLESEGLLGMKSLKGPFPMDVTYQFRELEGDTLARITVQGNAGGFYKVAAPLMARMVKRNISKDQKALKELLEAQANQGVTLA